MAVRDLVMAAAGASTAAPPGQVVYNVDGTYSWVCPAGVTSVSVVCVGAGGSSALSASYGGGGLGYKNNIAVTPGTSYTVVVGGNYNGTSYFISTGTVRGGGAPANSMSGGTYTGDGGGNGGNGGGTNRGFGGAGGYSGNGGNGASTGGSNGAAGSGGGGGGGSCRTQNGFFACAGGGGVGLLGQGANGAGGVVGTSAGGGQGGSGGNNGLPATARTDRNTFSGGGNYGGGGSVASAGYGLYGAVRIIWPGTTRQFPSTNTGDM